MGHFEPRLIASGIGSLPILDPTEAVNFVFEHVPELPFWPQLPKKSPREDMWCQYTPSLPFVKVQYEDPEKDLERLLFVDPEADYGLNIQTLFERILHGDLDSFALKEEDASGWFKFLEQLSTRYANERFPVLKGHVTGPLTLAAGITGLPDRPGEKTKTLVYDENIIPLDDDGDIIGLPNAIGMMAAWQANRLINHADRVIIFLDEPALQGFEGAFSVVQLAPQTVVSILNKTIGAMRDNCIQPDKVLVGMHCCGDSSWQYLLNSNLDIINWDAYKYWSHFANQKEAIKRFISRGGIIAFGLVPTDLDNLQKETPDSLLMRLANQIQELVDKGIEKKRLLSQSMLTPACGYGTKSMEECKTGFNLLKEVSTLARDYFSSALS